MSKDDFRDRLKSYSIDPEHGDWVKMQQLLEADEEDRIGIAWWKWGALFALLLIPSAIYFSSGSTSDVVNTPSNLANSNSELNTIDNSQIVKEQESNISKAINVRQAQSEIEKSIEPVQTKNASTPLKTTNKINTNSKTSSNLSNKNKKAPSTNSNSTNPIASNSSQFKANKLPVVNPSIPVSGISKNETKLKKQLIAALSPVAVFETSIFNIAKRDLAEVPQASTIKVSYKSNVDPWYLVTNVGVKYPIVNISEARIGSFIPSQKFFPSYEAGIGLGKHFGNVSVEAGVSASLYQYKLGKVFNPDQLNGSFAPIETQDVDLYNEADNSFIISKFAVISPFLRGQYSFDLKNNFVFGLYAMLNLNRKINLADEFISSDVSNSFDRTFQLSRESIAAATRGTNLNCDLGFSLEKKLSKKGRIAVDFSYSFASGNLEEGSYTILRETQAETNGLYSISGAGPKVKFRYYLNFKS